MKFVMTMPYGSYVMTPEDTLLLVQILGRAERYETHYRPKDEGGSTHHVYPSSADDLNFRGLSEDIYRVAKLAGKRVED